MKAVILAGGFGTRLGEETDVKPKPMIDIGGKPVLWHILKLYSKFGINDFIICCGHKAYVIKEYFANYFLHMSDVTFDMKENRMKVHSKRAEPWEITLVDTGENSMTGGRIKKVSNYLKEEEVFFLTYGDGLSDVNIKETLTFHKKHEKAITMTSIQPPSRYGALNIEKNNVVTNFLEKPEGEGSWINGGFFICEPKVMDYIEGDATVFEKEPLTSLVKEKELIAWQHRGFWACMDTLRDKNYLCRLWETGAAPWKIWEG